MSKQQGRIEAFGESMDECLKSADRGGGSVGARNCMEIRSAISDLWAAAVVDDAKRAADPARRERIHAETLHDLMVEFAAWKVSNMPNARGLAAQAVEAIAAGRIRHLTITY